MSEKYTDALELAFDKVKEVEAAGAAGNQHVTRQQERMAQLWCLIAIATEVRQLRRELVADLADKTFLSDGAGEA